MICRIILNANNTFVEMAKKLYSLVFNPENISIALKKVNPNNNAVKMYILVWLESFIIKILSRVQFLPFQ